MIANEISSRDDQRPVVSVIMPTFNSTRTIVRALKSVLSQTYQDFEIIIADDASKDDTRQQIATVVDPRISFLESPEISNKGPAPTRNRALAKARGTYIAFLDSDDEWFPEKLERQVRFLESYPLCSLVVSNAYDVAPDGKIIETEFDAAPAIDGAEAWRTLLKYSFIETSSVMTRRSLVDELGRFDPKLLVSQDQDLWIRLALRGEVGVIREILGKIHQVPTGHMNRNYRRHANFLLPMIEGHVARQRDRLSQREVDDILGQRYQVAGRNLFLHGHFLLGLRLLMRACSHNGNWFRNLLYVCQANPPALALKKAIRAQRKSA